MNVYFWLHGNSEYVSVEMGRGIVLAQPISLLCTKITTRKHDNHKVEELAYAHSQRVNVIRTLAATRYELK